MQRSREFSRKGLRDLHDAVTRAIEAQTFPGAITLVALGNEVHVETLGEMNFGSGQPMRRDAIFRIASMTKSVTAVGMLLLLEDGAFTLDDHVDRWLPELANRSVLRRVDGPLSDTIPANRPITIDDLMTMRAGYGWLPMSSDRYPIQEEIDRRGFGFDMEIWNTPNDEWMSRLVDLPLIHQPGEAWLYHTASEVLGVLIARVTGKRFSAFLEERILDPLGMRDTGFYVPPNEIDRLPTCYSVDESTGETIVQDPAREGIFSRQPAFESGGGGLVSTVDDFLVFAQMLLNGGRYDHGQLLSAASIADMTADHLTQAQKDRSEFAMGSGWGYGVGVATDQGQTSVLEGEYGWAGAFGTSWRNNPATGLASIFMTQMLGSDPVNAVMQDFHTLALAAVAE
jgi:CubicO group peptidase (beta-lactamase class C family)